MRIRTITCLSLLVVALSVGCGGDYGKNDEMVPATSEALEGRAFVSTEIEGRELVPGSTINMGFGSVTLGLQAGCNSISGEYDLSEGSLEFSPGPSTLIACSEKLMAQEQWLTGFLQDGVEAELEGDVLVLSGGESVTIALEDQSN